MTGNQVIGNQVTGDQVTGDQVTKGFAYTDFFSNVFIIDDASPGVTIWIFLYSFRERRCLSPETIKCALFSTVNTRKMLSKRKIKGDELKTAFIVFTNFFRSLCRLPINRKIRSPLSPTLLEIIPGPFPLFLRLFAS